MLFLGFILLLGVVASVALCNIASRKASTNLRTHELPYFMMLVGALVFNGIYAVQLMAGEGLPTHISNLNHIELLLPILYEAPSLH